MLAPHARDVEEALDKGYAYLLAGQKEDGTFPGEYGRSAGVVSLAGMAFLAAGHTPGRDANGRFILRCVDYVLAQQNEEGYILAGHAKDKGMYSHNIATLFLAEVSGMLAPEKDLEVREALARATQEN